MLKFKKGVKTKGLRPEMIVALRAGVDAFNSFTPGKDCIVTSALDGKHKEGSFHPDGLALDFRIKHLGKTKKAQADAARHIALHLGLLLGEEYDIYIHDTHIHVEYDPKPGGLKWKKISTGKLPSSAFVA